MIIRSERKWQAATALVGLMILGIFTSGGVYLASANTDLRTDLAESRQDTRASVANANDLYQQLLVLGVKPEAEKPAAVVAGNDGKSGNDGAPGRPPTAEEVSSSVAAYCLIRLDCVGAAGPAGPVAPALIPIDGEDGTDGTDGAAGADSTTPGPVGATGADSIVPGPTGPTGEPPASWAYTDPAGVRYDCTRTAPFDPAAPTYQCAAQPIGATP